MWMRFIESMSQFKQDKREMNEHQYYNRTDDELALYREVWDSINSLGGTVKDDDFIGQAGNITVDNALGMLEITFRHCHRPREFGSEWCVCGDNLRSKVHRPETVSTGQ